MADRFEKNLPLGNTDTYTVTVNPKWLNDETIASHTVTVDGVIVQKNSSGVIDNVIGVSLTALSTGGAKIHFWWETSGGRSNCKTMILVCLDSCF